MKLLANWLRFLLIAMVAMVGFLIWQRHRHSDNQTPAPAGDAATPALMAARLPAQSPGVVPSAQPQPETSALSPNPTNDAGALIHLKLRQWLESQTGDSETQDRLLKEFLAMLTDENAAEIIQSLSHEELTTPLGIAALERWLKVDLAQAADWIAARADATEDQAWLVGRKMLEDPAGLRNLQSYSDQLTNAQWKQQFLEGAGLLALETNPAVVINLAQRMNPDRAQTNLLQTVAYDWISRDPNAALDWIMSVSDPLLREKLIGIGAQAYAATDPRVAADWLISMVKSDGTLNDAVLHVVDAWVAKTPVAAAQWVAGLPVGGTRDAAVDTITRQWLQSDSGAATAWILTLPEKDKVLLRLISDQVEQSHSVVEPE